MGSELDNVLVTLSIAGQKCENYISIVLDQRFNDHHRFEAIVNYEQLDSKWFDNPEKIINMIGETAEISMTHKQSGGNNTFSGIITETAIIGQHGQKGDIVIRGCSPTIKLDGCRHMDSYMDKTLKLIVDEVVGEQGNGIPITTKPIYSSLIDYIGQYDETAFEFLNRLSYIYGEYFYYDGTMIYFGNPMKTSASTIIYDIHLQNIELCSTLVPGQFSRYHYLVHDDKQIDSPKPGISSTPYANLAKSRSEAIYGAEAFNHIQGAIRTKKDMDDLVKMERTRQVGAMHCVKGNSQSCKVKIGEGLNVSLPSSMEVFKNVGNFMVTEVRHIVKADGRYFNEFKAIPVGTENIPMAEPRMPVVGPQMATVKTNDDDKKLGRVKVEFQWQKKKGKTTNWIRVQTPDAGKSSYVSKNRGFVFIPEKDDYVMVGFEYGDPNRPFVMGSIFSEKISTGNKQGNHFKTMTDKSGGQILMNTDEEGAWGITIHDRNGNIMHFDTKEKNITITTPETMTFNAKNMNINVLENMTINVQKDWLAQVSGEKTENIGKNEKIYINQDFELEAKNTIVKSLHKSLVQVGDKLEQIAGEMTMHSNRGKILIDGTGKITIQSKDRIDYGE